MPQPILWTPAGRLKMNVQRSGLETSTGPGEHSDICLQGEKAVGNNMYQPGGTWPNLTTLFIGSDPLTCFTRILGIFRPRKHEEITRNALRNVRYHWRQWDPKWPSFGFKRTDGSTVQDRWLWVKFSTLPTSRFFGLFSDSRLIPSGELT